MISLSVDSTVGIVQEEGASPLCYGSLSLSPCPCKSGTYKEFERGMSVEDR